MFTGLIEDIGRLARVEVKGKGGSLTVATGLPIEEIRVGDSIAVNGACLTATWLGEGCFSVDFSRETSVRTAFRDARPGAAVHLERAMRLSDRLDGHLVLGHVDAVGQIQASIPQQDSWRLEIACPQEVSRYLVEKGSVAVHGVSLTVNSVYEGGFSVTIVPLTQQKTFLTQLAPGALVNLEADMLAKYVERLLGKQPGTSDARDGVSLATLLTSGFGG